MGSSIPYNKRELKNIDFTGCGHKCVFQYKKSVFSVSFSPKIKHKGYMCNVLKNLILFQNEGQVLHQKWLYMGKKPLSQDLKCIRINYLIDYRIPWEKNGLALYFCPLLPLLTRWVPENGGNLLLCIQWHIPFSPRRMAQPPLTPLSLTAPLTGLNQNMGSPIKPNCPSDQLLITFQHHFTNRTGHRIAWGNKIWSWIWSEKRVHSTWNFFTVSLPPFTSIFIFPGAPKSSN